LRNRSGTPVRAGGRQAAALTRILRRGILAATGQGLENMQIAGTTIPDLRRKTLALPERPGAELREVVEALALVGAVTLCLISLRSVLSLAHVSIVYLVPVLIAAAWWGVLPAIVSAVAGVAASAFLFYPPLYEFRVASPQQVVDLILFVCVAIVTGRLADNVRRNLEAVQQREEEVRSLYAFSRRLASASTAGDILSAIREHLSSILGRRTVIFERGESGLTPVGGEAGIPDAIRSAIAEIDHGKGERCIDGQWLLRAVSDRNSTFGMVAIDVDRHPADAGDSVRARVDTALADAAATFERLDVARAIEEARARANVETYLEALIGSVSHELRTPLASIIGSASVLSQAPAVVLDERLAGLAAVVRDEAERLNSDIQNLLDASRISSAGVRAQLAWSDPADLIDAAVERHRRRLLERPISIQLEDDLPLVHVDAVLIVQALRQIIDNAAKYSPAGSRITIGARGVGGRVAIRVEDRGMGLTAEEKARLFQRFHRNPRHRATAAGSGLGLWIARAFVVVSGGTLSIDSLGPGEGATVTMELPAPPYAGSDAEDPGDD
jgi:two-component system sensor histidine kinase KdpD